MSFPRYSEYKGSGVEWLGEVPGHWDVRKARWLCGIKKRIAGELGHEVLSITQQGIRVRDLVSNDGQISMDYSKYQIVEVGDFAMNHMDLLTGYVDIANVPGVTSPDYRVFSIRNPTICHDKYLLYLFQMGYKNRIFYAYGQGSSQLGRWRMPTEQFYELAFPLPPTPEQTQIAAFLDRETAKIDALVAEQRQLMALLKEKRQAVISHAVTRGLNLHAPMKPSGIEWLGDVPDHWEVKPMRMIANVVRGASPRPAGDPRYFGGDAVPWVTVGEITKDDEVYLTETEYFLTQEGATHSNLFKSDTLVYSNSGATLGVPKVLRIDACANDGVVAFLNLDNRVQVEFLYHYLASITDSIREKVKQGSGQPNLNTDIVKDLRFGLPPLAEQKLIVTRITELANEFGALATEAQRAIDLLQERRTALISAAVTGQIDVRNAVTP